MTDKVISVKMPTSLVAALEERRGQDHYLDLSEQLRSIVRQKCLELTNPYVEGLKQLDADFKDRIAGQTAKEQVLQELIKLLREGKQ